MKLNYHQRTFDYLQKEPVFDEQSEWLLKQVEAELSITIPPSVREWYSTQGSVDLLREHSNCDHPRSPKNLGYDQALDLPSPLTKGLLVFLVENQGVCVWAVRLDDAQEDPPVFVAWNEPDAQWQQATERFSDFIFAQVWDYSSAGYSINAIGDPLVENDLAHLRRELDEQIRTANRPGVTNYRFSRADKRILIWNWLQADWYLFAGTQERLLELGRTVWSRIQLPLSVYALSSDDESVHAIAQKLLSEFGRNP